MRGGFLAQPATGCSKEIKMRREPTSQELIDRYIFSIETLLPPDKAHDIVAEIQSNLQSLLEDRSAELGRDLSLDEVSAILKQQGHPMIVAGRYRDSAFWGFSPELLRIYKLALGAILALIFTVLIIKACYIFPGRSSLGSFLWQLGRELFFAGIIVTAGVTTIFAAWEYLEFKFRFWERWNPKSLAPVPTPVSRRRAPRPLVQIMGDVALLAFLALALFYRPLFWLWGGGHHVDLSPAGSAIRVPLLLVAAFAVSQSWLKYTRFASALWRRFLRLAVYLAGLALAVYLVRAGDVLVPSGNWGTPGYSASLTTLNRMISGTSVLATLLLLLGCVYELRRSMRRLGSHSQN
jgi:hypothetical protein